MASKWAQALTLALLSPQVSQAGGRTQLVKPGTVMAGTSGIMATGKAITRTVTDREVAALIKQQQLNKSGQLTQVRCNQLHRGGKAGDPVEVNYEN